MKLAVLLVSFIAYVSAKSYPQDLSDVNPVYGYLTKYGIPEGERIQKAEEEFLRTPAAKIVGGSPAALGQFKYQAGLITDIVGINGRGVCGGSLITPNRVLTAAHCWFDGRNQAWRVTVVLESILLFSGGTRIESTDVQLHPQWFPLLIINDIAVIRLPVNVPLSETVGTIALPTGSLSTEDFVGEAAVASGFGITRDGGGISDDQFLSHVTMNVIPNSLCSLAFPTAIRPSNICTRTIGGTSTCRGDSGGPLAVNRNGEPVLVGITSFGSALGCEIGFPAAFVRVSSFLDFINQSL